jgi:hypothetical protein
VSINLFAQLFFSIILLSFVILGRRKEVYSSGNKMLWLGFSDRAREGTFVNSNGLPANYTNWNEGEPNNHGLSGGELLSYHFWRSDGTRAITLFQCIPFLVEEDCAMMLADDITGKWNDGDCNDAARHACKYLAP